MTQSPIESIITVTLNPTIDRIIEVPGFHVGGHLVGRLRSQLPAGKAINVSRTLASLGVRNTAAGWVGQRSVQAFEQAARAAGVVARFTPIAGPTRENITIIDPKGAPDTHIRDVGPAVTDEDVARLSDELTALANRSTLFVFTGSCAPGLAPTAFAGLIDTAMSQGARVAVDSSGEPLRHAARRSLWMIKPNLVELADLVGHELPENDADAIIQAGRQLNERIEIVLVTMGARGAYCFSRGIVLKGQCAVPPDRVRSTVGCGDAMLGGFLAAASKQDWTIESALRQGLTVSAASAMNEQPAVFNKHDLHELTPPTVERIRTAGHSHSSEYHH